MRTLIPLIVLSFVLFWPGAAIFADRAGSMTQDNETIESIRMRYEAQILETEGVVGVSTGIDEDGTPCLMVLTSAPPESVRSALPKEIFEVCVRINDVGEIKPQ